MSFTKLCEKFMLLSNSGRKKKIPPARSGMHDKSSETRTILCLQCLSSPNKHSHRQHSSVSVLRRTTATRECQGQSLAQTWRNMPSCEISGTGLLNLSSSRQRKFLEIQQQQRDAWKRWHSDADIQSIHRPDEMCALKFSGVFFLFKKNVSCETRGWKV